MAEEDWDSRVEPRASAEWEARRAPVILEVRSADAIPLVFLPLLSIWIFFEYLGGVFVAGG